MPVSIVGGRSSGKSVFVALLINTAINYGAKNKYDFKLYRDTNTCTITGNMLGSLKMSLWPPATIKGSLLEYNFSFGYIRIWAKKLMETELALREKIGKINETSSRTDRRKYFNEFPFKLVDIAGEDVELLNKFLEESKRTGVPINEAVAPTLLSALNSDVLVFLIDCEKIATDRKDPRYNAMLDYDTLMSSLIAFVSKHRSMNERENVNLFPVFVLTKFDGIDPVIKKGLGVSENYIQWVDKLGNDKSFRLKFFEHFMTSFFRSTLVAIRGASLVGTELEDGPIFVSYALTELNDEGILVPKVIQKGQANEIMYSEVEYKRFIRYLGKISKKLSDKKKSDTDIPAVGIG
jgi:hypothetical protein